MEDILECGCGLDVHKESIVACLLKGTPITGNKPEKEIQEFGTQMKNLIQLREWLRERHCMYVAMESTGVYWQPIYAVLEQSLSDEMHLLVVIARHMRIVPGKKTDMRDAEWIAMAVRQDAPFRAIFGSICGIRPNFITAQVGSCPKCYRWLAIPNSPSPVRHIPPLAASRSSQTIPFRTQC